MNRLLVLGFFALMTGTLVPLRANAQEEGETPARYLYIWMGDRDEEDSDFVAIVDVLSSVRRSTQRQWQLGDVDPPPLGPA